jgi:HEPN domain-containing protein
MNRTAFQTLAKLRVREAKALLDNKRYEGAYYVLGYALECALKSCIAKQFGRHDIPDKNKVNDIWTHDLNKLLALSGLKTALDAERKANPSFDLNWTIAKDWSERARYEVSVSSQKAKDFYVAVTNRRNGVLSWLKKQW